MKFMKMEKKFKGMKFIIEQDYIDVGWYAYVYSGKDCIRDYLQDNLQHAKEILFEEYGVPLEIWEEY